MLFLVLEKGAEDYLVSCRICVNTTITTSIIHITRKL